MIHLQHTHPEARPVVVYLFSPGSDSCRVMEPVIHELKELAGHKATIVLLDIDQHEDYRVNYDVVSVPEVLIFHQGYLTWRKSGMAPAHEILEQLQVREETGFQ